MKTQNTTVVSLIILTAVFAASCSKKEAEAPREAPKPARVLNQDKINANDGIFTLTRNGQTVTIQWQEDFSKAKYIEIFRNTTGLPRDRPTVAHLDSKSQSHDDIVPNAGAFWYWLNVVMPTGRPIHIGPTRIGPDEANTGTYVNNDEIYLFNAGRNDASGSISWSVPREKLDHIIIKRTTNPKSPASNSNRKEVITTREWEGKIDDAFPDPNADYWYFMEACLADGTQINCGPIKAEYAGN